MKENYKKLSFASSVNEEDPHFINFIVSPANGNNLPNPSFSTPLMLEGVFFALCLKGTAKIKLNAKSYNLSADTILMLKPGQLIHITEKSEDFLVESIYVSVDFLIGLPVFKDFRQFFNSRRFSCLKVTKETKLNLLEYYSFIIKRYNNTNQKYKDNIMQGLLTALIMEYLATYDTDIREEEKCYSRRQDEITDNFMSLLVENCNTQRSVSFYADRLCITPKYLSSTIKQTTGKSVLEWIHEMFIINSKMLLKNSNKTVSEICDEMKVSNDSFFCRLFREQTGMSPLQYRNLA